MERTYRIGEVAEMLNLKTHVLRFWETEFSELAPLRTESGQRLYNDENIAVLRRIQQLLHEQGMTIEGAKRILAGAPADENECARAASDSELISDIRMELAQICEILRRTGRE